MSDLALDRIASAVIKVALAIHQHGEDQITAAKINANAQALASGNMPRYQSDGSVKRSDGYRDNL